MTKESLIWLAIRFAGLVFVYMAIVSTVTFVNTYITLSQTSALTSQASVLGDYKTPALTALSDRAASLASFVLVGQFFYIVFYSVIAGYLLRGGKLVFDLLNREGAGDEERTGVIDTLHLGDS